MAATLTGRLRYRPTRCGQPSLQTDPRDAYGGFSSGRGRKPAAQPPGNLHAPSLPLAAREAGRPAPTALAELSLCKSACPHQARRGCYLIYTLLISNTGPGTARDVVLEDAAPGELCRAQFTADEGLTWSPWEGRCALGDIPPGECRAIYVAGIVDRHARGPVLRNTASVRAATPGPAVYDAAVILETPIHP